eukprot:TRINITY_DN12210_c0_g1_i1.p1 TRINITY_DN12210_c0_g1~~TRINITY_DN12210_c0_g1_i1.p1  ORF type:complete len:717 (-),score=45.99 TRINITY_DN12210_c0_g1_i1:166-2031(-)
MDQSPDSGDWSIQGETMTVSDHRFPPLKIYRKNGFEQCSAAAPCSATVHFNRSICSTDSGIAVGHVWKTCQFFGGFAIQLPGRFVTTTTVTTTFFTVDATMASTKDGNTWLTWGDHTTLKTGMLVTSTMARETITSVPDFMDGARWFEMPARFWHNDYFNRFTITCRSPCEMYYVEGWVFGIIGGVRQDLMDTSPDKGGWYLESETMGVSNNRFPPMKIYKQDAFHSCTEAAPCVRTVSFNRTLCSTDYGVPANQVWKTCQFFGGVAVKPVEAIFNDATVVTSLQDGSSRQTWPGEPLSIGTPVASAPGASTSAVISSIPSSLVGAVWYGMPRYYSSQRYFSRFTINCYSPCVAFFLEGAVAGIRHHLLDNSPDKAGWVLQGASVAVSSSSDGPLTIHQKVLGTECSMFAPCNVSAYFDSRNCTTTPGSCRFFGGFAIKPYAAPTRFPFATVRAGGIMWQAAVLRNSTMVSLDGKRVIQNVPEQIAFSSELYRASIGSPQISSITVTANRSLRVLHLTPLVQPQTLSISFSGGRSCQDGSLLATASGQWNQIEDANVVMNDAGTEQGYTVHWADVPGYCTKVDPCTVTLSLASSLAFRGAIAVQPVMHAGCEQLATAMAPS